MASSVWIVALLLTSPAVAEDPTISRPAHADADAPVASPNYRRATLGTLALLTGGTIWYWRNPGGQSDDWDLNFDWTSWRRKLDLDAVRFDTNVYATNAISHPISGSVYYHAARENGLSLFEAYLSAFLASTFWEFIVEFHEMPSLNDMIMTPAGGMVLGESTYRLGRLFAAGPPTMVNRAGAWVFTPVASLNQLLDGRRPTRGGYLPYHRLFLELGGLSARLADQRRDELSLTVGSAIVTHAGYRQPGQASVVVGPGTWSGISLRVLTAQRGAPQGVAVHAKTLFAGRYARSYLDVDRGAGLLLGVGGSFDYEVRALASGWDRVASVGLLGPTAELTFDRPWLHARLALSGAYSFGILQSLAFRLYGAGLPLEALKTTLRREGYYYAHGVTANAALTLRVNIVELALGSDLGLFRSLQGRDRYQERLGQELALNDRRTTWSAVVALRLLGGLSLAGRVEKIERRSHLAGRTASADETRLGLFSNLLF
jgi:hypothetical protein